MTVQEKPYPVVSLVVDTFGEWLKHRRELREMREMDAANFGRIASELRMSSADLEALVRQGPHAADELPKMLQALGVDQDDLARTEPLVLRDMERVCSLCNHKRQCDRDLAAGTAAAH
jgi:transcriptional regulator with XRE-family HTH domain